MLKDSNPFFKAFLKGYWYLSFLKACLRDSKPFVKGLFKGSLSFFVNACLRYPYPCYEASLRDAYPVSRPCLRDSYPALRHKATTLNGPDLMFHTAVLIFNGCRHGRRNNQKQLSKAVLRDSYFCWKAVLRDPCSFQGLFMVFLSF